MKIAYNETWFENLQLVKEAKGWLKNCFITEEQFKKIRDQHRSEFFHPNLIIRILLFIASIIAISGLTGLLVLLVDDAGDDIISTLALLYGIISFVVLEVFFIKKIRHYKSGVAEAVLYHAIIFTVGGSAALWDFESYPIIISCIIVFTFAAIRFLDLVSTSGAVLSFSYLLFSILYDLGGIFQQIIPFVFIVVFGALYFYLKKLKLKPHLELWTNCLILTEALFLLLVYGGGNYLVVRELSISMMNLEVPEGSDIPFALLFYILTVAIPILYLYAGIKDKDKVLLRVSLAVLAFSVFTFKYYYSTGHHEITFTVSGAALLLISLGLFRYLRVPKNGYTRENITKENWASANPEAFIMSQTLGGNKVEAGDDSFSGSGGAFGGGGATGNY